MTRNKKKIINNSVLYILINKDFKMSKGKIIAEIAHLMSKIIRKSTNIDQWIENGEPKIVLKGTQQEIKQVVRSARDINVLVSSIYDAGRTQVPAGSNTVVGIGPCEKSEIAIYTKDLKMY